MHILHVIHSVDPRSGGPSHSLRGLVKAQVIQGHRVTVLATVAQSAEPWAPRDDFVARMQADPDFVGARLILGPAWGRHRPWSRFSYCPQTVRLLRGILQQPETRPDVMHVHGAFSHLTIAAFRLARRFGIPYIFRPAGSFDATCMKRGMAAWKQVFMVLFHQRDLRQAGAVHVTSQAEAHQLARWCESACIYVIPHGIDLPPELRAEECQAFLKQFSDLRNRRIILYLSRLHEKKRPQWLLDSYMRLRREFPDLSLVFAGPDAGMEAALRQSATTAGVDGEVIFSGFLDGCAKAAVFTLASVFCLPSEDENFGVAVLEAMAYGVPVVVTPGVASHVYVDEAGCGLTVDDNIEALTDGLRQILRADRAELGRRGREYVTKHLTWPRIAQRVEEMYREILHGNFKHP